MEGKETLTGHRVQETNLRFTSVETLRTSLTLRLKKYFSDIRSLYVKTGITTFINWNIVSMISAY